MLYKDTTWVTSFRAHTRISFWVNENKLETSPMAEVLVTPQANISLD
jgi:hypothetical protein